MHQPRSGAQRGGGELHRREDIGAVRIAEADDRAWVNLSLARFDAGDHLGGGAAQIRHVIAALAGPPKIAQRSALTDIAAWRDDVSAREQLGCKIKELVFV